MIYSNPKKKHDGKKQQQQTPKQKNMVAKTMELNT